MQEAPPPPDEAERLAELRDIGILDTDPDARFDALVRVAAQFYDVPIALVSLVDADRQWFKARHGLAVQETPRAQSFCAHAILAPDEVMVVDDAARDPRFVDNPLVTGTPGIRFYAGAPICSPTNGQPLGTLCIIDRRPRHLTEGERKRLKDLALGVASLLDLHRSVMTLQHAATHDPLTGLANRACFDAAVQQAIAEAPDVPIALLCLDLDGFKPINDTYGHAAGDLALQEVAQRIARQIRHTDLAARLGGDEFSILQRGPFAEDGPGRLARRIMAAFEEPVRLDGHAVTVRTSIGIACAPADGETAAVLLRAGDMALYRAKAMGPGSIARTSDIAATFGLITDGALDKALRHAIEAGTLGVAWQPYFDLASGLVVGNEVLTRWVLEDGTPVPPARFIPMAERSGLVTDLDAWVLRRACQDAAGWPEPLHVAVNISPSWISRGDLTGLVADVLATSGLAPHRLVLEITERMIIEAPGLARTQIDALRDLGVVVALDDFGAGHSSLSALSSFTFDKVKLDMTFLRDIETDPRARSFLRAVLNFTRDVRLRVCAEGIETQAQFRFVRDHGCALGQGFLFGRPAPQPIRQALRNPAIPDRRLAAPYGPAQPDAASRRNARSGSYGFATPG